MVNKDILLPAGTVHKLPNDLRDALRSDADVVDKWLDITPLARNEFICWIENAKQIKTRARRVRRTCEELQEGKKRPCCWIGCIHRTDKDMSPSQQYIFSNQDKTT